MLRGISALANELRALALKSLLTDCSPISLTLVLVDAARAYVGSVRLTSIHVAYSGSGVDDTLRTAASLHFKHEHRKQNSIRYMTLLLIPSKALTSPVKLSFRHQSCIPREVWWASRQHPVWITSHSPDPPSASDSRAKTAIAQGCFAERRTPARAAPAACLSCIRGGGRRH